MSPMLRLGQLKSVNNLIRIIFQVILYHIQCHLRESTMKLNTQGEWGALNFSFGGCVALGFPSGYTLTFHCLK